MTPDFDFVNLIIASDSLKSNLKRASEEFALAQAIHFLKLEAGCRSSENCSILA